MILASFKRFPYVNMKKALAGAQINLKEWILDVADGIMGVFSTSKIENGLLMWAHYSQQHEGMMLQIDSEYLKGRGPYPIRYDSVRPASDFSLYKDSQILSQEVLRLMTTKSLDWQYEKELRFFISPKECRIETTCDGRQFNMLKIDPKSVRKLVLGIKTSRDSENAVKAIIRTEENHHIELFRAQIDESDYKIATARIVI